MLASRDRPRGLVLINGRAYPAEEVIGALEQQAMTQLRIIGNVLWIGNQQVRPLAKTTAEQAMMLTCFGSLAYCCPLSKECSRRDEALRLLGMTREEYQNIKDEAHQRFLRFADERWPYGELQHSSPASDSSRPVQYTVGHTAATQSSGASSLYSHTASTAGQTSHSLQMQRTTENSFRTSQPEHQEPVPLLGIGGRKASTPTNFGSSSTNGAIDLASLFGGQPKGLDTSHTSQSSSIRERDSRLQHNNGGFKPESWRISPIPPSGAGGEYHPFCIHCGQDLEEGTEFCPKCGRRQE